MRINQSNIETLHQCNLPTSSQKNIPRMILFTSSLLQWSVSSWLTSFLMSLSSGSENLKMQKINLVSGWQPWKCQIHSLLTNGFFQIHWQFESLLCILHLLSTYAGSVLRLSATKIIDELINFIKQPTRWRSSESNSHEHKYKLPLFC